MSIRDKVWAKRREELRELAARIKERDEKLKSKDGRGQRIFRSEIPLVIDALLTVAELEP